MPEDKGLNEVYTDLEQQAHLEQRDKYHNIVEKLIVLAHDTPNDMEFGAVARETLKSIQ